MKTLQVRSSIQLVLRSIIVGVVALLSLVPLAGAGLASQMSDQRATGMIACSPGVPAVDCGQATIIYNHVVSHNFSPPPGYRGGGVYGNTTGLLPPPVDVYLEFRLYTTPGSAQRLVIDRGNPGAGAWFTPDHYATFVQFYTVL